VNAALWLAAACMLVGCEVVSRRLDHGWPDLGRMLRGARGNVAGRLVLIGAWLWLGWHVFAR